MNFNLFLTGKFPRFSVKACLVIVVLVFVGCGSLKDLTNRDKICESQPAVEGAANVSIFLNVLRPDASRPNLNLKINSVELLVDDSWVLVSSDVVEINSAEAIPRQKFLGRQWLKGACRGVRVKVAGATLTRGNDNHALPLINSESEIMMQSQVELEAGTRKVILLEWDPEKSVSSAGFEGISLKAFGAGVARIAANLVYISCPEIDTVYVVRIDKLQVVDAFAVSGNPSYLLVDSDNKKIHVLASSLNKIIPYDISTHLPGSEINIPLANSPLFMAVNDRSQTAYVLDDQGVLSSIDLVSGDMLNHKRIGNRPNYLYYIAGFGKLAVSSIIDQTVYLVNPDSLAVEDSITLGSAPLGLVSWGSYLYITENTTDLVSVYDLSTRKMLKNIPVGFEPSRLVATDSSVYVSNLLDGTVAVIQGGQLSVIKEMVIGKSARELAVAEKQRLLFVGEGDCNGSVVVIDTTGNHLLGRIELGAKPMGIAVIE